jgi:hypothetical protein
LVTSRLGRRARRAAADLAMRAVLASPASTHGRTEPQSREGRAREPMEEGEVEWKLVRAWPEAGQDCR